MMRTRLSIDFGTTNTAAAFVDGSGQFHEVRLSSSSDLMPSAVFADEDSGLVVGTAARNLAATRPDAFEGNPKSRLGEAEIFLAGRQYATAELAAAVIRHALGVATRVHGNNFDEVVLTHPDSWAGQMQSQLRAAAVGAGLESRHVSLVSEAEAAAAFYSRSNSQPDDSRICVFDFGAGTCDVAVLDINGSGSCSVVASDGLDHLGGNDLDARIFAWTVEQIEKSNPTLLSGLEKIQNRLTLLDRIRDAKETLSWASKAHIPVGGDTSLLLTRTEFNSLIQSDVSRCIDLTQRVVDAANEVSRRPVSNIYLVGGSSHIPLVHSALSDIAEVATLGDPMMVVASGALFASDQEEVRPIDVTANSGGGEGTSVSDGATGQNGGDSSGERDRVHKKPVNVFLKVGMVAAVVTLATTLGALALTSGDGGGPDPTKTTQRTSTPFKTSGAVTTLNSLPQVFATCVLAGNDSPTSSDCELLELVPSSVSDNTTCTNLAAEALLGAVSGITCIPDSYQESPYLGVNIYDFSGSITPESVKWGYVSMTGTFPEPNSVIAGASGPRYSVMTPQATNALCSAISPDTAACIFYDPDTISPKDVYDWWLSQPDIY